jgi:hypothetical protein
LFNLGGPYWKSLDAGGQQEREVAATYERYAKACEFSWPRTAAALLRVAQSYLDMAAFIKQKLESAGLFKHPLKGAEGRRR